MQSIKESAPKKRTEPAAANRQLAPGYSGISLSPPFQKKPNETGLPDQLKDGVESLSGYSMDDVNVHYNSSKPAQLNAHAYAQGTDIHVGPGQEKHLPHEAWHVVQQKQGRVKPTRQLKGKVNINDDTVLEKEADVMGTKASSSSGYKNLNKVEFTASDSTIQRFLKKEEIEITDYKANEIKIFLIQILKDIIECPDPKVEREKQALEKWDQFQNFAERAKAIKEDPIGELTKEVAKKYWDSLQPLEKAELVAQATSQVAKGLVLLLKKILLPAFGGSEGSVASGQSLVDFSFEDLGSIGLKNDDLNLLYGFLKARYEFNKQKKEAKEEVEKGKGYFKEKAQKVIGKVGKGVGSREAEKERDKLKEKHRDLILALQNKYEELNKDVKTHKNVESRYDELFNLFHPLLNNVKTQPLAYIVLSKGDLTGDDRTKLKKQAILYLTLLESAKINIPLTENIGNYIDSSINTVKGVFGK